MTVFITYAMIPIGIFKVAMFAITVRNAIRPRPLPAPQTPVDPDGPDDGWRWWEQFEPEPEPPKPAGSPRELACR